MKKYLPKFTGEVGGTFEKPTLNFEQRPQFVKYLQSLFKKRFEMTIDKYKKPRSLPQNAFWHGIWLPILLEDEKTRHGNIHLTDDQICFYWRKKCPVTRENVQIGGKPHIYIRSTASLNSDEMSDFLMFVQTESAKDGTILPPANKEEAIEKSLEMADVKRETPKEKPVSGFRGKKFSFEK